jgi:hypothetical protein
VRRGVLQIDFDGGEVTARLTNMQVCIAHASNVYPMGVSNQVPPRGISLVVVRKKETPPGVA